jgi:DNA anti-recombination protein RmuC
LRCQANTTGSAASNSRRIAKFAEHLSNRRQGLERAAKAHNDAVASFEGRILPTARRVAELGVADGASIAAPAPVETQIRQTADGNGTGSRPDLDAVS